MQGWSVKGFSVQGEKWLKRNKMLELNPAYPPDYHVRILLLVQVQLLTFRVSGVGFRVSGFGCGRLSFGCRVSGFGFSDEMISDFSEWSLACTG